MGYQGVLAGSIGGVKFYSAAAKMRDSLALGVFPGPGEHRGMPIDG